MNKSIITLQLPIKLFNADNYEPIALASGKVNPWGSNPVKGYTFDVYGSNELSEDLFLMPIVHIGYAQITVYFDLQKALNLKLKEKKFNHLSCLLGIHSNLKHQSRLSYSEGF
jgi:hypothetical protein